MHAADAKVLPIPLGGLLLALSVAIVWGLNFVMIKLALDQIPPVTLSALRFLFASVPAIFFVPRPNGAWKYTIFYGLLTFALPFSFLFFGMSLGVSPGIASMVLQLQVFFAMLFACLVIRQAIHGWQVLGAIISFSGICVIALHHNLDCNLTGFFLIIAAAFSWGLGTVISMRLKTANLFSLVVWGSFFAFIPLASAAFLLEKPLPLLLHPETFTITTILALAYITYISTHFGYGCWSWLLSKYPAGNIVPFSLLSPLITLCFSSLILQESFQSWKVTAAVLVTIGLGLNIFGKTTYALLINLRDRFFKKKHLLA